MTIRFFTTQIVAPRFLSTSLLVMMTAVTSSILAGDIAKGKSKSAICAGCHGQDGVGISPLFPNLAGQKAAYTAAQLKAFRDGQRKNMTMSPMSKGLTDEDIENIAAYYESLPAKK